MNIIPKVFIRSHSTNDRFAGIQLGDLAADSITGFKGIVISQCSHISGCDQLALQPQLTGAAFEDCRWFDIERVEMIERGFARVSDRRTGADTTPASRTPTKTQFR